MKPEERLLRLFEGSDFAHGQTTVGKVSRTGKTEARSIVVREPLTPELVRKHLNGDQGIGSIPIRTDNCCRFGAIDVDEYELDLPALARRIKSIKLPLVLCRSKSGGAHLFLFLKDWELASVVREHLTDMAAALGFAGRELFPKQDTILVDRGDVGNFINLPYFSASRTLRYGLNSDGEALDLEDFLTLAEASRVSLAQLEKVVVAQIMEGDLRHYPPCLQKIMEALGPVTSNRNITLFNFGVATKKEDPDNWKQRLNEANNRYMSPPLDTAEISLIERQHDRKSYGFQCGVSPLKDYCQKELCRKRKFGIGGQEDAKMPALTGLTVILSDPPLYFMDVDGTRIELSLDELMNPTLFQKACAYQLRRAPHVPRPAKWVSLIDGLLQNASLVDVSPELTLAGQFHELLKDYCTGRIQAMSPEELMLGKPFTEEGKTKFRIEGLMEFLKQRGFTKYTRAQVLEQIKKMNDGGTCSGHRSIKREDGTFTTTRVWWVPVFNDVMIDLGTSNGQAEIPF